MEKLQTWNWLLGRFHTFSGRTYAWPNRERPEEKDIQLALHKAALETESDIDAVWAAANDEESTFTETEPASGEARLLAGEVDKDLGPRYLLGGRVVTMNDGGDVIVNGLVAVDRGVIKGIFDKAHRIPAVFSDAPLIETGGTIYPGLIDLHNHFVYNVLPLWLVPKKYTNRSQWRNHREYKSGVSLPLKKALACFSVTAKSIVRFVEAKALLGGTTTGQGMRTTVKGGPRLFRGAMRNVEETDDPRLPEASTRVPNLYVNKKSYIKKFRKTLKDTAKRGAAYFYHLSEGIDDVAHRHFENLENNKLISSSLVGIHSLGLTADDFKTMANNGAKVVWSP